MTPNNWTIADIPDLTGKTIIVTGGNSGLGFESVKAFAWKGASVIMACRTVAKGEDAKKQIVKFLPSADITVMRLDLTDLESVRDFVSNFKKNHIRLDVLLNNAGIMMVPYNVTKDGFESQLATNHLGHFALTGLLLDVLRNTPKSRVVNVSSLAHKWGEMDFNNLLYENGNGYSPTKAYSRSKLSNLLFTYELQRFFEQHKIDAISLASHPGLSDTNLANHLVKKWYFRLLQPILFRMFQPPSMGALPEIRASVDPGASANEFYGPGGKRQMKGYPVTVHPKMKAHDKESARKLWEVSEKLTSVTYS
ncbi:MAG: oxidoreductase [Bacteroidota bacterium]|nr:oxidoreductase [Bacteroidota bacterium]